MGRKTSPLIDPCLLDPGFHLKQYTIPFVPACVHIPNGISIDLSVLAQLTVVTNRQTDWHAHTVTHRHTTHVRSVGTRCKAKPDCSPPGHRHLSIIVTCSVYWFACFSYRSTCTSCRILSHTNPIRGSKKQKFVCCGTLYWCDQQHSSTVDLVYYIYDVRARRGWMHKVYYILVTVTKKLCGLDKQKLVAMATSLERSQPNFTAIVYARKATNRENLAKIGRDFWNNWARTNSKKRKQFRQLGSFKVI